VVDWVVLVVFVVVVFFVVVVVCVVVTGGVGPVVVDFVVAVVVTGATRVTGAVVVTTGAGVVTAVVVELLGTECFLRWDFLRCTARLRGATATDDVALDVVDEVGLLGTAEVVEVLPPPELPQPTITTPAITASSAAFIRRTPVAAPRLVPKANNG
jgi:hypothetical protein